MSIRPESWIETLLASPPQVRLLRLLARDPERAWTEREAAAEAGLAPSSAHVAFKRLQATDLLDVRRVGRNSLVRLRTDFELGRRLVELFRAESETLERALKAAAAAMPSGVALYLFGSTARGETTSTSDIDLLVYAKTSEAAESAATAARNAIWAILPARVEIVALDADDAGKPRYRQLLTNVRREGQRLTPTRLEAIPA